MILELAKEHIGCAHFARDAFIVCVFGGAAENGGIEFFENALCGVMRKAEIQASTILRGRGPRKSFYLGNSGVAKNFLATIER